jgi:hypothetical protein
MRGARTSCVRARRDAVAAPSASPRPSLLSYSANAISARQSRALLVSAHVQDASAELDKSFSAALDEQ